MQCFLGGLYLTAGYSILQTLTWFSFHLLTAVHSGFFTVGFIFSSWNAMNSLTIFHFHDSCLLGKIC